MMNTPHTRMRGFTLMELLITVTIIGLLSAIALPQYQQHVARSRRVAAGSTLLDAAQFMQKLMDSNNGTYQVAGAVPALPTALQTAPQNTTGNDVVYNIAVATPTPNTFVLTASPRAGGPMASDACGNLTLDQRGRKGITGSGKTVQDCWK